jgi:hypothetical protein
MLVDRLTVGTLTVLVAASCAAPIRDLEIQSVRYQPNASTVSDLIGQIGLPNESQAVVVGDTKYLRLVYLVGPERRVAYSLSTTRISESTVLAQVSRSELRLKPREALVCLATEAKVLVQCETTSESAK